MNLTDLFQQAQKMRGEMQKIQDTLATKTVEGFSGGGMVKVVANGKHQVLKIDIDPEIWKTHDKQMIEDLVVAGVNQALQAAQGMMGEEMKKLAGGMGPLGSLFGQ